MPQKRKPPRLWLRKAAADRPATWVIKDGERSHRTGCGAGEIEKAQRILAEYIEAKYQAPRGGRSAEVTVGDVILVYLDEKAPGTAAPKTTQQALGRLNEFFGRHPLSDIRGKLCRAFAEHRGTQSGARRDLEVLRAAINYYHKEYGLDVVPSVTLPVGSATRTSGWPTRSSGSTS